MPHKTSCNAAPDKADCMRTPLTHTSCPIHTAYPYSCNIPISCGNDSLADKKPCQWKSERLKNAVKNSLVCCKSSLSSTSMPKQKNARCLSRSTGHAVRHTAAAILFASVSDCGRRATAAASRKTKPHSKHSEGNVKSLHANNGFWCVSQVSIACCRANGERTTSKPQQAHNNPTPRKTTTKYYKSNH